jgi:hypothetical protein
MRRFIGMMADHYHVAIGHLGILWKRDHTAYAHFLASIARSACTAVYPKTIEGC